MAKIDEFCMVRAWLGALDTQVKVKCVSSKKS